MKPVSGKLETDGVCLRWTETFLSCFVLFVFVSVFCFSPSNVLGVLLGKFSADHLVFLIVILDQVLVETCGSIGLEIFVGACPGCARGVVPPLSCVGLLQLPDPDLECFYGGFAFSCHCSELWSFPFWNFCGNLHCIDLDFCWSVAPTWSPLFQRYFQLYFCCILLPFSGLVWW